MIKKIIITQSLTRTKNKTSFEKMRLLSLFVLAGVIIATIDARNSELFIEPPKKSLFHFERDISVDETTGLDHADQKSLILF